jgi:putative two-component system response regulator
VRERILVVDDDPMVRDILVRFLQREGYQALVATNGNEALEIIAREAPDLVLLDVTMPGMDGFSVCRAIKENRRTALIPVTMLTGLDDRENRQRGIEAGADDFLPKPFDQPMLRARIRSQLRLKHLTDQLEHTESVIFSLALAVEVKDSYTEGHLWRLSEYGHQLALAYGLTSDVARWVRFGGLLHDIGKIGVSDTILGKSGPLTPAEYALMQTHTHIGARIVAPMRFAPQVAPILLGHHEFWNGAGYPQRLAGEQIPIGARIIAVLDSYDAMTTDRTYRPALSREEAIRRLRAGSGTQWDPVLIELFVGIVERGELVQPERRDLSELVQPTRAESAERRAESR